MSNKDRALFWKKAIWHRPCASVSSSPPRDKEGSFLCCPRGAPLDWISLEGGTSTPDALSRLVWGLSRAAISSDAVVYEHSRTLSLTRKNGFLALFCPRSPAPQKQNFIWVFHCLLPSITLRNEELAVAT